MSKYFMPPYGVNDVGVADVIISWESNSSSAVDQTKIRGLKVASVARADVGTFTVTLTEDVYRVLYAAAQPAGASTPDGAVAEVYIADETASPLVFTVSTLALTGDPSAYEAADLAAGRRIYVVLKAKLSSV